MENLFRLDLILIYYTINVVVLLKKFAGEEGERVDVQKLFGYIGLFTLVALWWLGKCCLISDFLATYSSFHVLIQVGSFCFNLRRPLVTPFIHY